MLARERTGTGRPNSKDYIGPDATTSSTGETENRGRLTQSSDSKHYAEAVIYRRRMAAFLCRVKQVEFALHKSCP